MTKVNELIVTLPVTELVETGLNVLLTVAVIAVAVLTVVIVVPAVTPAPVNTMLAT